MNIRQMMSCLALVALSSPLAFADPYDGLVEITTIDFARCHGVLITPSLDTPDSAPAYVITAGHCTTVAKNAGQVYRDVKNDPLQLAFNPNSDKPITVESVETVYARNITQVGKGAESDKVNLDGRDLAIVDTGATLGEMKKLGIVPRLIGAMPLRNDRLVGFSLVGYPVVLDVNGFEVDPPLSLMGRDTKQKSKKIIEPGSSGGPLVPILETPWVYAVADAIDNTTLKQRAFYSGLWDVKQCFEPATGVFDATRAGCPLLNPSCGEAKEADYEACIKSDCENGKSAFDCYVVAGESFKTNDYVTAQANFQKACDLGLADGCMNVGLLYEMGKTKKAESDPSQAPQALTAYQKACELDSTNGCAELGNLLLLGDDGVTADPASAVAPLSKGCILGSDLACMSLAQLYAQGQSVDKSDEQAQTFASRACNLAESPSVIQACSAAEQTNGQNKKK